MVRSKVFATLGMMLAVTCSGACDDEKTPPVTKAGSSGNNAGAGDNGNAGTSIGGTASSSDGGSGGGPLAGEAASGGSRAGNAQGGEATGGMGMAGKTGDAGASSTLGKPCVDQGACGSGEVCFDDSASCIGATCQRKKSGCNQNTCGCLPATTCPAPGMCFSAANCVYCLTPP